MKKLTITSDGENTFVLESRRIINKELILVVSDPNDDAFIEINFGHNLIVDSSVIKIVTEDESPYHDPVYFDGGISITNSEIKGKIQFENGVVYNAKIEGTVEFD